MVLWHPQIKAWTALTNKMSLYIFTKSKTKIFNTYEDVSIEIIWISSEQVFFKPMLKWFLCLE